MKRTFAAGMIVLNIALAGCRGAEQPRVTHWYGTGSYTTGVYEDPSWYTVPGPM